VAWNWEGEDVMCRLPLTGVAAVSLFFLTWIRPTLFFSVPSLSFFSTVVLLYAVH
jgi:hypothetical protein